MSVTLLRVASSLSLEVPNSIGLHDSVRNVKLLDSSKFVRDFGSLRGKKDSKKVRKWRFCSLSTDMNYECVGQSGFESASNFPLLLNVLANPAAGEVAVSSEQKVYDVVLKQAYLVKRKLSSTDEVEVKPEIVLPGNLSLLSEAYDRCGEICAEYAKTFYLVGRAARAQQQAMAKQAASSNKGEPILKEVFERESAILDTMH